MGAQHTPQCILEVRASLVMRDRAVLDLVMRDLVMRDLAERYDLCEHDLREQCDPSDLQRFDHVLHVCLSLRDRALQLTV